MWGRGVMEAESVPGKQMDGWLPSPSQRRLMLWQSVGPDMCFNFFLLCSSSLRIEDSRWRDQL